jgi:peptidoglycan/LPS O-acetylase OafA/YrhL
MRAERIPFLDGLRGLAIAMVLLFHAWMSHPPRPWGPTWFHNRPALPGHSSLLDLIVARGYHGVTLFFVLSGFCLAYPALRRRERGDQRWFQPSVFLTRRFLRILPPFYAALGLSCLLFIILRTGHWPLTPDMTGAHLDAFTLLSHLLLLHNLSTGAYVLNGPFWSLALEWQWYWLFPLVLLSAVRAPRATTLGCLIVSMTWAATMNGNQLLVSWLPGELFAFVCGILVALAVVRGHPVPAWQLAAGSLLAFTAAEAPFGTAVGDLGLYIPLYAIAFALIIALAARSTTLQRMLSVRPLIRLGAISYSVYLLHRPAIDLVELNAPPVLRASYLVIPLAISAGIAAGALLYLAVERPTMHPAVHRRLGPLLQRLLAWTDRLYPAGTRTPAPAVHHHHPPAMLAAAPAPDPVGGRRP